MWLVAQPEPWTVSARALAVLRSQMRVLGAPTAEVWLTPSGVGIDFERRWDADGDEDQPPDMDYALIERHTLEHAGVKQAAALMAAHPEKTLRELRNLLEATLR